MKKVLVTGADGFAGSQLCNILAEDGYPVLGVGLRDVSEDLPYEYRICDILDRGAFEKIIAECKPDVLYHLAAMPSTQVVEGNKHLAVRLNSMAIIDVIEICAELAPGCTILVFSSGEVYGPNADINSPHTEKTPTVEPINFYTATKIGQETYAKYLAKEHNVPLIIIRPFSMTGPGQRKQFVMGSWGSQIAHIKKGLSEPVIKVGNLEIHRDFIDVRDAMKGAAKLSEVNVDPGKYNIYNICTGTPRHLAKVLDDFISISGVDIKVDVDPARVRKSDYPIFFGLNIKLTNECDWKPEIPFNQTLSDIVSEFEKIL